MKLSIVINQLREHCPTFSERVVGAARYRRIDENTNLDMPCAYVMPEADQPAPPRYVNAPGQSVTESFMVVVALDNTPSERGQDAVTDAVDSIRAELFAALLGWQPDGLGSESRYTGLYYDGGSLLDVDRKRLWYQYIFAAEFEITDEDGYQAIALSELPPFEGMTINVDIIDPAADPNLQYPGPDGRIEYQINIPPTGTLPQ